MPRPNRTTPGGIPFHVLNRAVGRRTLFATAEDNTVFLETVAETLRTRPMRVCAYCVMPNHWHMILWPEHDGTLSAFVQHLTNIHGSVGRRPTGRSATGICIKADSSRSRCNRRSIFTPLFGTLYETQCGQTSFVRPTSGRGRVLAKRLSRLRFQWLRGRCPSRRPPLVWSGLTGSTGLKRKQSWPPCERARTVVSRSATRPGSKPRPIAWISAARSDRWDARHDGNGAGTPPDDGPRWAAAYADCPDLVAGTIF